MATPPHHPGLGGRERAHLEPAHLKSYNGNRGYVTTKISMDALTAGFPRADYVATPVCLFHEGVVRDPGRGGRSWWRGGRLLSKVRGSHFGREFQSLLRAHIADVAQLLATPSAD